MTYIKPKNQVYSVTGKLQEKVHSSKENLWHRRYSHLGIKGLQKLARDNLVEDFDYSDAKEISFCEPSLKGNTKGANSLRTVRRRRLNLLS